MTEIDDAIYLLQRELSSRVDAYEIFLSSHRGLKVEAKDGNTELFNLSRNNGVGIRIINNRKLGFAFTNKLKDAALKEMVNRAISICSEAGKDEYLAIPSPPKSRPSHVINIFDKGLKDVSEEEKIDIVLKIEKGARDFDNRIKKVRTACYREKYRKTRIVNSNGFDEEYSGTYVTCSIMVVAEEGGDSEMGWEIETAHHLSEMDFENVGKEAARRAVAMLKARTLNTRRCSLLMENRAVCELMEVLASSFLLDNLEKGKSMLMGKMGKRIASSVVNIYDDGIMPKGWAAAPFDGEGMPMQRTEIVKDGIFNAFLSDTYWGRRRGIESTGNAVRAAYKNLPAIGATNVYMEGSGPGLEELKSVMGEGLFITDLLAVHTIDGITGEFSLGASGFLVERGRILHPVRGIVISGNLLELLLRVTVIGGDKRFIGSIGAPSIIFRDMEVSGSK